ncbi:3 beta-hydroxysteroid dehydrogenase/Delta 5--_4-isomerase [Pirellulimonas nuda]|uniref:3 beta-hydroxysteroid dehydrogenase/Delta 5-->4-isomerase n=1 Tax=Pirellulimonas nuda TaxID=2528009 RepID=A0A518DIC1_9BACT|nr:NAD-dependent epimerase/dehydratase family protein [Pirellulimonas nuda]QDU91228.1 3 beta-hydroxysteroid dehydrogenase/Delta 5-->4-isomerase [Pirellulimonas nuda]
MTSARILVTGAAGFIGKRLCDHLRTAGNPVRAATRTEASAQRLRDDGWDARCVEMRDPSALAAALEGVDQVYHLASVVSARSFAAARQVNVEGSRLLALEAAKRESPPRLLYVSSLAASGPVEGGRARTEADPGRPVSYYGRTKLEAEQALRGLADRLPVVAVRPPGVFGPGDLNLLQMFRSVRAGLNFVAVSQRYRYSFVYVEDLAEGMRRAMEAGDRLTHDHPSDGLYFLADPQPMTFGQLGDAVAAALGRRPPRCVTIPAAGCWGVATAPELWGRLTGAKTYLNYDKIREAVAGEWFCDPARADRELDWRPEKGLADRLIDTHNWYVRQKLLPANR